MTFFVWKDAYLRIDIFNIFHYFWDLDLYAGAPMCGGAKEKWIINISKCIKILFFGMSSFERLALAVSYPNVKDTFNKRKYTGYSSLEITAD